MKKRTIILSSFIALCLIVSVSALLIVNTNTSISPPVEDIACHTIQENPGGINIVFLANEDEAIKYSDYLLTTTPFNEYPEKFSFYYISREDYVPECDLYQGIAILCSSRNNIKAASACQNDYTVILESRPAAIRSSAFRGIMSLNTNHPLSVFGHEFGHALANFAEEYIAQGASIPRGAENCEEDCSDFKQLQNSENYDCHKGCTDSNHNREYENGIMKTLHANRYGNLDEDLLREKIEELTQEEVSITGLVTHENPCEDEQFYLIENGEVEIFQGCEPGFEEYGEHSYEITDETGETITTGRTRSTLFITDYNPETGIPTEPPRIIEEEIVTVPFTGQEEQLIIYDDQGIQIQETTLKGAGARPCRV